FQPSREQPCPHGREVVTPAKLGSQGRYVHIVGGVHEFEILKMVSGGARGSLSQFVTYMVEGGQQELVKRGEEVVVARFFPATPVTHRPCVDDLVIQNMVFIGASDGWLVGILLAGIAGRSNQVGRGVVYAETVFGGVVDPGLGVDRTREVIVQVATLGHLAQKGQQEWRLIPDRLQVTGGPSLACEVRLCST